MITDEKSKTSNRMEAKVNRASTMSPHHKILTDIYKEDVNITVWQQEISDDLINSSLKFIEQPPNFKAVLTITPTDVYEHLIQLLSEFSDANEVFHC